MRENYWDLGQAKVIRLDTKNMSHKMKNEYTRLHQNSVKKTLLQCIRVEHLQQLISKYIETMKVSINIEEKTICSDYVFYKSQKSIIKHDPN